MEFVESRYVEFTGDDPGGLWKAGDVATDLGWESTLSPEDSHFVPVRLLRLDLTDEIIALTDPWGRGLIEALR